MSKIMTYDYWVDNYKPIKNEIAGYDQLHFETYGAEYAEVENANTNNVWTEVDGDSGTYIISGWHFVNRIHYYITENPWEDEYTEIPTWMYRECDNAIDGECNVDCPECDGDSTIDIPVDTIEELREVYGEEAEIVS